jgi:serine protease Do
MLASIVWAIAILPLDLTAQTNAGAATKPAVSTFVQSMIEKAQPAMVKVIGASAGRVQGATTGFLVSHDGLVVTSQGVYLDGKRVQVILANGSKHEASILKRDRQRQLALLKIEAETPNYFELAERPVVQQGDWIVAICNAFKVADKDEPISATLGIVSLQTNIEAKLSKRDYAYFGELLLIDAITSNPGAAGGAVLSVNGKLAGMVGKIINSSETNTRLNYAVPAEVLHRFVFDKPTGEPTAEGPGETGVEQSSTAKKSPGELGILIFRLGGKNGPAYVDRVKRGSVAAKAKLKTDDLIVSIDGEKIGNIKDYDAAVKNIVAGEEVLVIYKRGRKLVRTRLIPSSKGK